jgi:hypothetical protein
MLVAIERQRGYLPAGLGDRRREDKVVHHKQEAT